jgi:hypothetical protein
MHVLPRLLEHARASYQISYVTFSNQTYNVVPGEQILMAWVKIAANAPAANVTLAVDLSRKAYPSG